MNAEIYRDREWVEFVEFESYEVHKSGRLILRGVTAVKVFGELHARLDTVVVPADLTVYIKERD